MVDTTRQVRCDPHLEPNSAGEPALGLAAPAAVPPEVDRALRQELARLQRELRQPSLSAALARGGQLVWSGAVGSRNRPGQRPEWPADDPLPGSRTTYRVGSITKPMVALAVLRLAQDGVIELDEPVRRRLPDSWVGPATVAQLLSHTSGLRAEPDGPWWERAGGPTWEQLSAQHSHHGVPPAGPVRYSNVGYAVIGRLLETLTGMSWDEAVRRLVWEPLGMVDTGTGPGLEAADGMAVHPFADVTHHEPVAEYAAMGPAGGAWSTPVDLVRLAACLSGHGPDALLLGAPWRRRMSVPVGVWDTPGAAWTAGQGCGLTIWNEGGRRWLGHTGSVPGFTSDLLFDPDTGDAAAVCGNATHPHHGGRPMLAALARLAPPEGEAYRPGPCPSGHPLRADLAGTWYLGPVPMIVAVATGDLGIPTLRLYHASDPSAVTVFEPDGSDWVGVAGGYWYGERLRVHDEHLPAYLDVGTFRLTRHPYQPEADIPGGVDPAGWR
ncbi:MAG: beta-lactamase family protein [Austwickia sp.]|nr:beta-lactamase family protein [Austwickia sp.]MBK8437808.1 beta-lactamase family protein [Austwickia sp.]MBK9100115.1 beta-lactamase family protein [Austwickia sp.]